VSRRAKNSLEQARERAAELLGAGRPLEIVFTGGGTEADNLAVAGPVLAARNAGAVRTGVVTSAVEHEAVLETARFVSRLGIAVEVVGVDGAGRVDPEAVASAVTATTALVSVMTANNETGVVQPIRKIAEAARGVGPDVLVHTDAVQAYLAEEITVAATGADLISLAAHKLGGPKGVGLLYVRDGVTLEHVLHGGGQELGRRSGTHNVAGIVGMVTAMEAVTAEREAFRRRTGAARNGFIDTLRGFHPDLVVTAETAERLPQHAHLRFPGVAAETLLIRLDQAGIAAAAGSACHSGAVGISHVLEAMGMDPAAASECVRFSFGWPDRPESGPAAAEIVAGVVADLR
jgi:cysteine desulfurase